MAAGSGAYLHGFIEWVESKLSACSDGASSTNLLNRCKLYAAEKRQRGCMLSAPFGKSPTQNARGTPAMREPKAPKVCAGMRRATSFSHSSVRKTGQFDCIAPANRLHKWPNHAGDRGKPVGSNWEVAAHARSCASMTTCAGLGTRTGRLEAKGQHHRVGDSGDFLSANACAPALFLVEGPGAPSPRPVPGPTAVLQTVVLREISQDTWDP